MNYWYLNNFLFYQLRQKQETNKQINKTMRKNVGMDTATAVSTSTASPDTTKKKKNKKY